jgi:putative aldouronate transport system permease protein
MLTLKSKMREHTSESVLLPHNRTGWQRLKHDLKKNWVMWIMIVPVIIYVLIFSYAPMPGIILAFKKFNYRDGILGSPWIWFDNFEFLVKGGILWRLTRNTVLYNIVFMLADVVFQIAVAIMLNEIIQKWFKKLSQSLMFLPYFISWVLVQSIVYGIFSYEYGLLNNILKTIGADPVNIYAMGGIWPALLTFFHEWKGLGYGVVIYMAAITGISSEYYEVAKLDGATKWQQIRLITLPLLKPTAITLLLFAVGKIMKGQFELFFQLVGNNGTLFNVTDIIDTYVFRTITTNFDPGMSTAVGLYQSLFGFILIMTVNHIIKKVQPDYALF